MPIINYIDPIARRIYLHSDTVGVPLHPIDIYREMRTLRSTNEALRAYDVFLTAKGNDPKGGGRFTERYVICMNGTRIVPFGTNQILEIVGTIITSEGEEGVICFDKTPLNVSTVVDIVYRPPQVEVIQVNTGSGLDAQQSTRLNEIHAAHFNRRILVGDTVTVYASDGVTPLRTFTVNPELTDINPNV